MQKKLLSLAIAGALAIPGAAMADVQSKSGGDVTIYGKFHASWDYVDAGTSNSDDSDDNTAVFRNSRLGFKGSEDLGNGLKGIWQVETHLDTGDDGVHLRNTYVGLQSDNFGKIFFGKHDTPYKTATAKLDIFSDTIADYNNIIGYHDSGSNFNEREPQLVTYETPNFNGFKAQIARESYQWDEDNDVAYDVVTDAWVAIPGDDEVEAWSVMGMYDQGPFFASVAYENFSGGMKSSTGDDDLDAWKIGLGYTFGNSKVGVVYEDIEHDTNNSVDSREAFWGSFSHKFGANVIKLAYGKADDSDNDDNDGADNWSIGIDHNFSKRTKVYAIYTDMDNDSNGAYSLYGADNLSNGNSGFYSVADGDDSDAFSVGIIHKF